VSGTSGSPDQAAALAALVSQQQQRFAGFVWRLLATRGGRPTREEVEDVLSEAYLVAARKLAHGPSPGIANLEAWYFRIAYLTALARARQRRRHDEEDLAAVVQAEHGTLDALDDRIALRQALASIADEREREILQLAAEGLPAPEIAARLGMTPTAVRQAKKRAIDQLRRGHARARSAP
jgi:RNA polymerase sigma-70 factor (ECF subfamily)